MTPGLMLPVAPLQLPELTTEELAEANLLWSQYNWRLGRNIIREQYYDSRNLFKNLGIAVPPEFEAVEWVIGWPSKAVDKLSARIRHQGFVVPGQKSDYGVSDIWQDNKMDLGLRQAITSTLIHSCSFLAATEGDESRGEPEILLSVGSALNSTGIWDPRLRALRSALFVTSTDWFGEALEIAIFFKDVTVRAWRDTRDQVFQTSRIPNKVGRVPVEPLVYKPRIERPFGYSRISRPVMAITDSALRTVARGELAAEFFSAPQRYIMGADESMFKDENGKTLTQWEAFIGRIFAAPMYEDADGTSHMPVPGTFSASDPNAQQSMLRGYAQMFAGETDIPVSSLGVSQESNPASADAINASREDLIYQAEDACDTIGAAVERLMITAAMMAAGKTQPTPQLSKLQSQWRDASTTTKAEQADAGLKIFAAAPWLAETSLGLQKLGLTPDEIEQALAERADNDAAKAAAAAAAVLPDAGAVDPAAPAVDDPNALPASTLTDKAGRATVATPVPA